MTSQEALGSGLPTRKVLMIITALISRHKRSLLWATHGKSVAKESWYLLDQGKKPSQPANWEGLRLASSPSSFSVSLTYFFWPIRIRFLLLRDPCRPGFPISLSPHLTRTSIRAQFHRQCATARGLMLPESMTIARNARGWTGSCSSTIIHASPSSGQMTFEFAGFRNLMHEICHERWG